MSELKGQLLAMVITLGAFGAISGVLVGSFTKSAETVSSKLSAADNSVTAKIATNNVGATFAL